MGRPKGSLNHKKGAVGTKKRLYPTEQVTDKKVKSNSVGFSSAKAIYKPYNYLGVTQIKELILKCSWIEDCVNVIVDEVVKYPLSANPKNKEIDSFLKYPSTVDPLFIIRKKYLKDMLRYGNGACIIAYEKGTVKALRPAAGYTLRQTDNNPPKYKLLNINEAYGDASEYLQGSNKKDLVLTSKEVMHFQIDADSDSTMARSSIERIYDMVNADKSLVKNLSQFLSKGFFKPSFISIDKGNSTEMQEFVEFLNTMLAEGAKIFGVNKKADLKDIPYWEAKDIIAMHKWAGLVIANAFKVPPFMLNLVEDVGSLNAREQRGRFLENVVLPILEYEGFVYTMKLARLGFKQTKTAITAPTMPLILNYNRVRTATMTIPKEESLLTVDEARKLFLNLDPKKETEPKPEGE